MSAACSQMSKIMNVAISYMHGKQAAHYENKNTSIKYYLTIKNMVCFILINRNEDFIARRLKDYVFFNKNLNIFLIYIFA